MRLLAEVPLSPLPFSASGCFFALAVAATTTSPNHQVDGATILHLQLQKQEVL